jgi:DNA-binding IclR family transcriptional regulator
MRLRVGSPDRRRITRGSLGAEGRRADLVASILGCYREMPGLNLRVDEAARLFDLRPNTCEIVLNDLVREGWLRRNFSGRYQLA